MALVINPDGTVSTIETTIDKNGNIKPKIDYSALREDASLGRSLSSTNTYSSIKEHKKSCATSKKARRKNGNRRALFTSSSDIDSFFKKRRENGRPIYFIEFSELKKNDVPNSLLPYFEKKYFEYREYVQYSSLMKPKERDKVLNRPKAQNKAKKKTKQKPKQIQQQTQSTLGDIASIGSLRTDSTSIEENKERREILKSLRAPVMERAKEKGNKVIKKAIQAHKANVPVKGSYKESHMDFPKPKYASSQDFEVRTSNPPRPARPPKYAYARDKFGRVQERDSFNEEKRNEFYTAQNRQKNYDYSSYDANDDHDGAYNDWE